MTETLNQLLNKRKEAYDTLYKILTKIDFLSVCDTKRAFQDNLRLRAEPSEALRPSGLLVATAILTHPNMVVLLQEIKIELRASHKVCQDIEDSITWFKMFGEDDSMGRLSATARSSNNFSVRVYK